MDWLGVQPQCGLIGPKLYVKMNQTEQVCPPIQQLLARNPGIVYCGRPSLCEGEQEDLLLQESKRKRNTNVRFITIIRL